MNPDPSRAVTRLPQGRLLRIHNGNGRAITVVRGAVWITQENDTRDVLLHAGGTFVFDRPGIAIVHALESTAVLTLEGGVIAERVTSSAASLPVPDVTPGSRLYRRAHQLRMAALAGFARERWERIRCGVRNLFYRVGLTTQPC